MSKKEPLKTAPLDDSENDLNTGNILPSSSFPSSLENNSKLSLPKPSIEELRPQTESLSAWFYRKSAKAWDIFIIDVKEAAREGRFNKFQYGLGCSSVFVVVVLDQILALSYSPVVFLSLAETQAGQVDYAISAGYWTQYDKLNYTEIKSALSGITDLHSPRFYGINSQIYTASACQGFDSKNPSAFEFTYMGLPGSDTDSNGAVNKSQSYCQSVSGGDCLDYLCSNTVQGSLFMIDTQREAQLGIGRSWHFGPIPESGIFIHQNLAMTLGVSVGDWIFVNFNYKDTFPPAYRMAQNTSGSDDQNGDVNIALQILQVLPDNLGKVSLEEKSTLYIEYATVLKVVWKHLSPLLSQDFVGAYYNFTDVEYLEQGITDVVFACASYRVGCYLASYQVISKNIIDQASTIVYTLGFDKVNSYIPVLSDLSSTRYFSAFLNLIFTIVIILLGSLSVFLIYSLLMVSVETRTFQLGIYRMIGMTKWGVVSLIIVQALSYAVPAWAFGLTFAQIAWLFIGKTLSKVINTDVEKWIPASAILTATFLGILVPVIAAILPIRNALSSNLHDALDTRRSKTKAVIMSIERTKQTQPPPIYFYAGLLLTLFGFVIYYFLPMALVYRNIELMFNIFLIILIGMLLGLVFLSLNLQPLLQRLLIQIMFFILFFENKSLPKLVEKNLIAHQLRNRKTSIMYALSLGFIIFLTVAVRIELSNMIFLDTQDLGGDIMIQMKDSYTNSKGVPVGIMTLDRLINYCDQSPDISSYALVSFNLQTLNGSNSQTSISNIGRTVNFNLDLYAASPNALDLINPSVYLVVDQLDHQLNQYSIFEQTLTVKGGYSLPLGTLYRDQIALESFQDQLIFMTGFKSDSSWKIDRQLIQPLSYISSAPIFSYSSFPTVTSQETQTSFPTFLYFLKSYQSVRQIPIERMIIKVKNSIKNHNFTSIVSDLSKIVIYESIDTLDSRISAISEAQNTLQYIFLVITLLTLIIAFFSLNSSMYTNIFEQKMEIGVLRSLGLSKFQMLRLFSYEAFTLILSASLLGTLIGIIVGWSIAAQRAILTQVPLQFVFPWDIFLLTFTVSMVSSVFVTLAPIMNLVYKRSIVSLLRS